MPGRNSAAFGKLPNALARDKRVSEELLVVIGYRCTFAGSYGLNERAICTGRSHTIASKGLGRDVFRRAMASGRQLGLIKRWQPAPKGTKYSFALDELCLPPAMQSYKHVRREWFAGQFSLRALALLLFIGAGTGRGPYTFAREISQRFGWSRPTIQAAIAELLSAGLIERIERRAGGGRFAGVCYGRARLGRPSSARAVASNKKAPSSKLPATGVTGDGQSGVTPNNPRDVLHKDTNHVIHKYHGVHRPDATALAEVPLTVREAATRSPRILGWVASDIDPLKCYDLDHDLAGSIYAGLDADWVREAIRKATDRRVSPEIMSDAGLYGVSAIAAPAPLCPTHVQAFHRAFRQR